MVVNSETVCCNDLGFPAKLPPKAEAAAVPADRTDRLQLGHAYKVADEQLASRDATHDALPVTGNMYFLTCNFGCVSVLQ